jgi:3',5'-cyclic AMP phosphodiesterase CpdA
LDAFIDEVLQSRPDALLLTGDITMNGERINHQELAEKLKRLTEEGIPVLIIPGNHDINNHWGRVYFGDQAEMTPQVSFQEFIELYQDFGWNQAISRDAASFSYIYPLSEKIWLMLLDTAQYEPVNQIEGAVRPETLVWMEENLKKARDAGAEVIVSGHHNLLPESRLFTTMCVLENHETVTRLLEDYQLTLYISGHLHLQRIQKHKTEPGEEGYGIYEIVSDAISIPPCQYGVLSWEETGKLSYETRQVDVSRWAERTGQTDENLLDFEGFKENYIQKLIKVQILKKKASLPDTVRDEMAQLYAFIYAEYCAGRRIDSRAVRETAAYQNWIRYLPDSTEWREMNQMLKDSTEDYNSLQLWAEP